MAKGHDTKWRRTLRAGSGLLAGTACLLGLPSALAAVSGDAGSLRDITAWRDISVSASGDLGAFTPATINPKLMASLRRASDARGEASSSLFRFTPAGAAKQGSRSVTVAVRVDPETARAISVRNALTEAGRGVAAVESLVFNLGVARGYQSFAQSPVLAPQSGTRSLTLPSEIGNVTAPDLRSFTPAKSASGKGRFSPTVEIEADNASGISPRTFGGAGEMSVDVGGAYRVAENLKVTAGIRYSSERDRLVPITDGQQDSQAVYVGTRFRF